MSGEGARSRPTMCSVSFEPTTVLALWPLTYLRAAAHAADQLVAANAVPVAEFLQLLGINLSGQNARRLVSLLRVTDATQGVNYPLPVVPHMHHHACIQLTPGNCVIDPFVQDFLGAGVTHVPAIDPCDEVFVVALGRDDDAACDREDRTRMPERSRPPSR
jgi:hypothetical protein